MAGKYLKIYLMPSAGGEAHAISPEDREQGIPSWSPDSQRLAFSDVPAVNSHPAGDEVLHIYDLSRRAFSNVPGTLGQKLWASRWSPDGCYLSALTIEGGQVRLFEFATGKWRSLPADHVDNQTWSHDGKFIYYHTGSGSYMLRRVRVSDGLVEDLYDLQHFPVAAYWWSGLTPDDSPIILKNRGVTEVYALKLEVR